MLWKLTAVLAFSLAWLSAPIARAEGETPECCDYNGFFIGAGGGYSFESFNGGNAGNSGIANLRLGYRFVDFVALEVLGEYMPYFNGKSGKYNGAHTALGTVQANAKLYPVARWTGWFQPYLLAGVGGMFERTSSGGNGSSDSGFLARYGGGIDYYVTEHFYLTTDAAYLQPNGHVTRFDQTVVGGALNWRF